MTINPDRPIPDALAGRILRRANDWNSNDAFLVGVLARIIDRPFHKIHELICESPDFAEDSFLHGFYFANGAIHTAAEEESKTEAAEGETP